MGWRKWLFHFTQHLLNHLWNILSSFTPLTSVRKTSINLSLVESHEETDEERLGEPGLFKLETRKLRVNLMAAFWYLWGASWGNGTGLFSEVHNSRVRVSGHKLKRGRFHLDIRKQKFILRISTCWDDLPRKVVESPSLEIFKTWLHKPLSNLVSIWCWECMVGRQKSEDSCC